MGNTHGHRRGEVFHAMEQHMQITSMEKFHVQEASQKKKLEEAYEKNTGLVIIETFKEKNPVYVPRSALHKSWTIYMGS